MNYEEKYRKYKNKYLNCKLKSYKIIGGSDCKSNITINPDDFSSFLKYIENKYNCQGKNKITKNKYLVILYGPSSSGKSLARKIATNIIKTSFNETINEKELYDTFMDTGVDELTYDKEFVDNNKSITVLEKLKKVFENYIKDNNIKLTNNNKYDIIHNNIDKLIEQSINPIYMKHRKDKMDNLSELLLFLASFLNKNIFFEVATANIDYIYKILAFLDWYNYIPILIYPFTYETNLLYKRSIDRGIKEGRFLKCSGIYSLEWQIEKNINIFNKFLLKEFPNKYKTCILYRYNTDLNNNDYQSINNFIFNNLNNYKLSEYKKINSDIKSKYNWELININNIKKCDLNIVKKL